MVTIRGYVPDDVYWPLFRDARLVLMPSTFEGWGMPIIEALSFGIPVVASRNVGLEEAGGPYVLYADPRCPEEFAAMAAMVLSDTKAIAERIEAGRIHAQSFTWQRAAMQTREALESAVQLHLRSRS